MEFQQVIDEKYFAIHYLKSSATLVFLRQKPLSVFICIYGRH